MTILLTREQAKQAEQEIADRNRKTVIRTSPHYQKAGKVRIWNVGPWSWAQSMGGLGTFTIPGFDPEKPFTVEVDGKERVFQCSEPLDIWRSFPEGYHLDMNKMAEVETDGEELANSICGIGRFQTPSSDMRRFGVFISAGDYPTTKEIAEANRRLKDYRLALVAEGSAFYQQGPNAAVNITEQHRDAAVATGNGKLPWVRMSVEMATCPACMSPLNPEAAICLSCKTVVSEEKVKALKIPGYEYLWKPEPKAPNAARS